MKTLHYRCSSIEDGAVKGTIGPNGLALAKAEGIKADNGMEEYDHLFHDNWVCTAQTALAFCAGLGYGLDPMPVVAEIGDDALFAEIATPKFRDATKVGASNFKALLQVHGKVKAMEWAEMAVAGVYKMFDAMSEGEAAIAFGHSPVIELAAWAVRGFAELPEDLHKLGDMEGIIFATDDANKIVVGPKISVAA